MGADENYLCINDRYFELQILSVKDISASFQHARFAGASE